LAGEFLTYAKENACFKDEVPKTRNLMEVYVSVLTSLHLSS
jgi:hypothetical protein